MGLTGCSWSFVRFLLACSLWTVRSFSIIDSAASPVLTQMDRRESLQTIASITSTTLISTTNAPINTAAAAAITNKVAFDVRIARQDGTFYVRDDLPDTPENTVFQGRIVFGLFGKVAPNHVDRFMQFVDAKEGPTFSRSMFTRYDEATGLVYGGTIPSLEQSELQGSPVLRYGERVLPAKLWLDSKDQAVTHRGIGLLTHDNFDATPTFGITTREDSSYLDDGRHTVFGQIVQDEGGFLDRVARLPIYSTERPQASVLDDSTVVQDAATAIYNAQKDFFRNTAKSFGDSRVSKIYQGKLLRRVEVTRVEKLS